MAKYIFDEDSWVIETNALVLGGEAIVRDNDRKHEFKGTIVAVAFIPDDNDNYIEQLSEGILYGSYDFTGYLCRFDCDEPLIDDVAIAVDVDWNGYEEEEE